MSGCEIKQGQCTGPRKIINVSFSNDVQLHKVENAWKPLGKKLAGGGQDRGAGDPEAAKTQELFRHVRSILNKLTPEKFERLVKQVTELTIDTEERLNGVVQIIFEKAISEPHFSSTYAKMCHCLKDLNVPSISNPGVTCNFQLLLLNQCYMEFERFSEGDEIIEKKKKELNASDSEEERQHLKEELEAKSNSLHKRSLGNMKFTGELFNLEMVKEDNMHSCISKLLETRNEEALHCLCCLLSGIGKNLDNKNSKLRMDQYFNQVESIIKERNTSSRIHFKLLDLMDLRKNNWVPRKGDQGPKTIIQVHRETELEKQQERRVEVKQQLWSKKDNQGSWRPLPALRHGSLQRDEDRKTLVSTKCSTSNTRQHSQMTQPSSSGSLEVSQEAKCAEPRKIINVSFSNDVQLHKVENAWKPVVKKQTRQGQDSGEEDPEAAKTQELFRQVRSILNKLTPEKFERLVKQVTELTIDTEERLKGVVHIIFETAISEPHFSGTYAKMCHCLRELNILTTKTPGVTSNFQLLLLNLCRTEFKKVNEGNDIIEKKKKELNNSTSEEERRHLKEELEAEIYTHRKRALGYMKFTGELFNLVMVKEASMHGCITKLLKTRNEEALECLCCLLFSIGKNMDYENSKLHMDQYFNQLELIIKEESISSRIRFKIQDLMDLRKNKWVPRRGDQGPKTISQVHKEAELEKKMERDKVQQQFQSKKDNQGSGRPITAWRTSSGKQDEDKKTPMSTKCSPINTSQHSKITQPSSLVSHDISQEAHCTEPRKIINLSFNGDVQLHKVQNAWKPPAKKLNREGQDRGAEDPEAAKTQELFCQVRSILNKLTPEKFERLVKQVTELTIDTEERLKGVVYIIFEKAISEPHFSGTYAKMCHCLKELNVPVINNPGVTCNFRLLLLNLCRMEFEKLNKGNEITEEKNKELHSSASEEERHLKEELPSKSNTHRKRLLGNMKFIGDLFNLELMKADNMHRCITELLETCNEEALECLCCLLSSIGKNLDYENSKLRMDQYFNQVELIIKERNTSSRIHFKLLDLMDLRKNNWVPRKGDQGPKIISQVHKEAELEKQMERDKVQQQLQSKKDNQGSGQPIAACKHSSLKQDEDKKTPMSTKCSPINTSQHSKVTQPSSLDGPKLSQEAQCTEPRKIINVSFSNDVQIHKVQNAWKPSAKKLNREGQDRGAEDPEAVKTEELFRQVRSILNKLTPEKFERLVKQVTELTIDTEERLKGVVQIIFEKAISEPHFSGTYAKMCHRLRKLNVPTVNNPGVTCNFQFLLLDLCRMEFERTDEGDEVMEKKKKELNNSASEEERRHLKEELEAKIYIHRKRALGNMKFTGELFNLVMVKEASMHGCITKLLKTRNEEALECLCCLLFSIGKNLDNKNSKLHMDQYFNQLELIIKEGNISSRIRFKIQDLMDLRKNNWVPRRGDQGPKTISQVHKEAELEKQMERDKVQQQLQSKKDNQGSLKQDEDKKTPMSTKCSHINTSQHNKITQEAQCTEPRKITNSVQFSGDKLKVENAWKPPAQRLAGGDQDRGTEEPEAAKTQKLFRQVRSILNKLTPEKFERLVKQLTELTIDTEECLKGVVHFIFEKAISEPHFSGTYANLCHSLREMCVPLASDGDVTLNFRLLLLNLCRLEFEALKDSKVFEEKQKKLDASTSEDEQLHLKEELEAELNIRHRRLLGNARFIGELFNLNMLKKATMHGCLTKLLRKLNDEALECLCCLLSTSGKKMDCGFSKLYLDQYFSQMEVIIKVGDVSSRIRFMLQDIVDLRENDWVPRRGDQGPKTISQVHQEAELEEQKERRRVQQLLKDDKGATH